MKVVPMGPLPVGSFLWQRRPGAWVFTFACKGTFTLHPGESPLAQQQDPIHVSDRHWSDDLERSLYAASDLVPMRPRADVMLVGHAFAQRGTAVRSLRACLIVGDIESAVEVCCDRSLSPSGELKEGSAFTQMPLLWERAAGGPGTSNPVGVRADARDRFGHRLLPNLQPPGARLARENEPIAPVAFGPVAASWPARRLKLGSYAGAWSASSWQSAPLSADFDLGYFNAAPPNQQTAALRDDEALVLEHLHPEHAHLVTRLPGLRPMALVERSGKPTASVAMRADQLWVHTDRAVVTVTWRGQIDLEHESEAGIVRIAFERSSSSARAPITGLLHASSARDAAPESRGELQTTAPEAFSSGVAATLPFVAARHEAPPPPRPAPPLPGLPFANAAHARPGVGPAPPPEPALVPRDEERAPSAVFVGVKPPALLHAVSAPPPAPLEPHSAESVQPSPRASAPSVAAAPREMIQLIWFDPQSVARAARTWRSVLDELDDVPVDRELEDPAHAGNPVAVEDRRDIFHLLAHAETTSPERIQEVLSAALRDDGRYVPPLRLVATELIFPFDELEALKASISVVTPLIGADEPFRAVVTSAQEFLKLHELRSAGAVADALVGRIRDAFSQGKRVVPPSYLNTQVERALLEHRCYQRRRVFGGVQIRALAPAGSGAIPVYLPDSLAETLPLFQRFKARIIAEVQPQVDQYETHPAALRVLALARTLPRSA
ncbi:DUF2169 domain-containing protein [Sorangium sp. So ce367]|uniref:DUF2169 family type VI secretion system accessory protein n=1 Tax=Sorangium sp. So ce367 TaxID=3133305 RepID=UPI003F5EFD91